MTLFIKFILWCPTQKLTIKYRWNVRLWLKLERCLEALNRLHIQGTYVWKPNVGLNINLFAYQWKDNKNRLLAFLSRELQNLGTILENSLLTPNKYLFNDEDKKEKKALSKKIHLYMIITEWYSTSFMCKEFLIYIIF